MYTFDSTTKHLHKSIVRRGKRTNQTAAADDDDLDDAGNDEE